jgi:predicted enzyme related to lactoylglutathione lyase
MPIPLVRLIIYVQDVTRLQSFYADNFDLPVIEEIKGEWVVFKAGPIDFALHRVGEQYRQGSAAGQNAKSASLTSKTGSNTKFVFAIDSNLQVHREKLIAAGAKVGNLKRYEGFPYEMYDGRDPEGNVFQVMRCD